MKSMKPVILQLVESSPTNYETSQLAAGWVNSYKQTTKSVKPVSLQLVESSPTNKKWTTWNHLACSWLSPTSLGYSTNKQWNMWNDLMCGRLIQFLPAWILLGRVMAAAVGFLLLLFLVCSDTVPQWYNKQTNCCCFWQEIMWNWIPAKLLALCTGIMYLTWLN